MIIAIAGRKGCGKSTIAQLLLDRGYKKASFAAPMKEYLCKIYGWQMDELNTQVGKESILPNPIMWDEKSCSLFSELSETLLPFAGDRLFSTRRELLQYLGTDFLRKIDPDFHVKKFRERFTGGNFVCDDLRFLNELETLKGMGAVCVYVARPYFWDYSNHSSEVTLNRKYFDYILLNDSNVNKIKRKFSMFLDDQMRVVKRTAPDRAEFVKAWVESGRDTGVMSKNWNCSRDKIVWWTTKYLIPISRNTYNLDEDRFLVPTLEAAYWAGLLSADGSIKRHLKHDYLLEFSSTDEVLVKGFADFLKTKKPKFSSKPERGKTKYSLTVSSPWLIEDLKLWNLEPLKGTFNKIPDCIKNDPELVNQWFVGLIDGDGSIFTKHGGKNLGITILASKEIIEFAREFFNLPGCIAQEKDIENLYNYKLSGKNAVALYKRIYRGRGLSRKWDQVIPFLNKEWR